MVEVSWSDWLDFSADQIANVPESSGVFMMHAAMKILYIGGSDNLRASIDKSLTSPCVNESKRFRYSAVNEYDKIKERLIAEYKEKHDGKMPRCME